MATRFFLSVLLLCCIVSPTLSIKRPGMFKPFYMRKKTTAQPTTIDTTTTTPTVAVSSVCQTFSNGTKVCSYKCEDGNLECLNGGRCILDDKHFPVCSCVDNWFGPHCEHKMLTSDPASVSDALLPEENNDAHLYLVLLAAASGVIAVLVVIIIVISVKARRCNNGGGVAKKRESVVGSGHRSSSIVEMFESSDRHSGSGCGSRVQSGCGSRVERTAPSDVVVPTALANVYIDDDTMTHKGAYDNPYSVYDTVDEDSKINNNTDKVEPPSLESDYSVPVPQTERY